MSDDLYFHDRTFHQNDELLPGVYESCEFKNLDRAEGNLSGYTFSDCSFWGCNLSLSKLSKTAFRKVHFKDCKLLGLRFDTCNEIGLSFSFEGCLLNHSSFNRLKIRKTIFKHCQLSDTDFSNSDIGESVFEECDLSKALFENCNAEKTDFRTARHFSIDPEINRLVKAKLSVLGLKGLLLKYGIEVSEN